jgi:lipopolysaccharide biosynthesis glycosyltransferase
LTGLIKDSFFFGLDMSKQMDNVAAVYTVTPSYIPQALLSALQIRRSLVGISIRIFVLCFSEPNAVNADIMSFFETNDIELVICPCKILDGLPVACARFFVSDVLPAEISSVLYLDADTQIGGSIADLMLLPLGQKSVLAAPDPMALISGHESNIGRSSARHLKSLSLNYEINEAYVNSGVLRFDLGHWKSISKECISIIKTRRDLIYLDQDALNLVAKGSIGLISIKWNFPAFFSNLPIVEMPNPLIMHFMSNPRPWHGSFLPWGESYYLNYRRLYEVFPGLDSLTKTLSPGRKLWYKIRSVDKYLFERRIWKSLIVRERLQSYQNHYFL